MKLTTALTVLFVGLKLTGYINWSWLLVLSPTIGCVAIWFVVVASAIAMGYNPK